MSQLNKKIIFFTELSFTGKVSRTHENMRTEYAWMAALDADHVPINNIQNYKDTTGYDLAIIILPKKNLKEIDYVLNANQWANKVAIMQEGPHWYYQDYEISLQFHFINQLRKADFILCHNFTDRLYYHGITSTNTYILQSLIITDLLTPRDIWNIKDEVIIGGNFVSWYSGMDSYIVAQEFNLPISAPSMGRKQYGEDLLDINYIPYHTWFKWMNILKQFKYAVHLMRTFAAGTFALNCAYWGIPCVGYNSLETQRLHLSALSLDVGDITSARRAIKMLKEDPRLYEHASSIAKQNFEDIYSEKIFIQKFKEILEAENI